MKKQLLALVLGAAALQISATADIANDINYKYTLAEVEACIKATPKAELKSRIAQIADLLTTNSNPETEKEKIAEFLKTIVTEEAQEATIQ